MTKQLLFSVTRKDLKVEYFRGSGNGGQKRNKTSSACRITHPESGAVGTAQEQRSQGQNTKAAFMRMFESPKFQAWWKMKCGRAVLSETEIAAAVEQMMRPENLLVETRNDGQWVRETV